MRTALRLAIVGGMGSVELLAGPVLFALVGIFLYGWVLIVTGVAELAASRDL